jgi:SPP1 family predicted phage head-tail adaptor
MKIGPLRDRLTIQTYTDTFNTYGETTKSWSTLTGTPVYAEIRPVSGRELIRADKVQGEVSHIITIRHLSTVTNRMQATDGTRTFQILAVIPDRTNKKMMQLLCTEKAT